jgi:hypothetical protein
MAITLVPRAPSVLQRAGNEAPRRIAPGVVSTPARSFQVLQSSRAPAQLCLFLRSGALDVK